jgi:RNA polymerase sigma factor (sigma-70 family)
MPAAACSSPAQRGDEEDLYRTHHRRLLRLIAADVTARPQVIEDACAFAWAELLARQPERTSIVGWLRLVARREAIRQAQRDRQTLSLSGLGADDPYPKRQPLSAPRGSPHDHAEALDALALVAALPVRKRAFLALKLSGHTYDEIASELGVSGRTVDRQLVRARRAVRGRNRGGRVARHC